MQAHLVTAPGDGVAPAVLLSLPGSGGASGGSGHRLPAVQYLFSVPEGFSRLVLEHKLRPGAGLRAAFAFDAVSLAGFGGLVMRLRGEGHDQLHVVGPTGTQAAVCSLRHFIRWHHPAVLLEEVAPWEQPTVYQDEHVAVMALWKPPLLAAMWPAPAWLVQPQPAWPATPAATSTDGSSSSERSSTDSGSSSSGDESESNSSGSNSPVSEEVAEQQAADNTGGTCSMFDTLDMLFMGGSSSSSRRLALEHLRKGREGTASSLVSAATAASLAASAGNKQPAVPPLSAATAAAKLAAAAAVRRQRQPREIGASAQAAASADDVAVVGGKRFQRLPVQAGINTWVCQKLATKAATAGAARRVGPMPKASSIGSAGQAYAGRHRWGSAAPSAVQQQQQQVLAFVCHFKTTDQLLLLTSLHSRGAAMQLQQHPALPLLLQQGKRVAGILHLAAPGVAGSRALLQLCQQLQPAVAAGLAGGQQLLLEQPGVHRSTQVIGHLAAARTIAKLNLVSRRIFPLPAGVPAPPAAVPGPVAAATSNVLRGGKTTATAERGTAPFISSEHSQLEWGRGPSEAEEQQQGAGCTEATSAARAEAAGAEASSSKSPCGGGGGGGLVHVRQMSLLSWQKQLAAPVLQNSGKADQVPGPVFTLEPVEGFVSGARFDAGAVQLEVQQQRPQLLAELEHLAKQQQQGLLPAVEQLQATGKAAWQCRENRVAPPLPPPAEPAHQPGVVPDGIAPPLPPQPQQPKIMRPLYQQQVIIAPHGPLETVYVQQQLQQLPWASLQPPPRQQQQPWPQAQAAPAASGGLQQQPLQEQSLALQPQAPGDGGLTSNKRAADSLRAHLQGGKRLRPDGAAASSGTDAEPAERQLQQVQAALAGEHQQQQPWLQGAPASICQLASGGAPEVLFLGTGSAEPSKYRAASAIQLRLACGQSLLLDCGEGALGALCRAYGTAAALRQVASLACLWVSHRHADHMAGMLALLAAYPASLPPLLVVGPLSLRDWLAEAVPPLRLASRYRFVHSAELNQPEHWARQALQRHLGICHLQCVPVRHCSDAYGLVLRHEQGWSLVYSGDTQPCQQLVQAGRGCTLLIHEATFEPCLKQQARQKRHSTVAEALEVAQRMGAYRCILTHFSQRYPKWPEGLPQLPAGEAAVTPDGGKTAAAPVSLSAASAAVAFDGMRVPLALLPVLPALMPAVQAALADAAEWEEEQAEGEDM